ncbi:MAG: hypothetical protein HOZ81_21510 [Streptomyces sp.]|nr:hypothetical protein [Streptomyces sp.]
MVFRSIWQGLQNVLAGATSDEDVKLQAIQDEAQTRRLIAIDNARGAIRVQLVTRIGLLGLVALIVLVGAVVLVVQAAGELKLPWSRIATVAATFLVTSGIAGLAARWWKRILKRRQAADATPESSSANPADGDQNQVGTS